MLTLWRPFEELWGLHRELDTRHRRAPVGDARPDFSPAVDIEEQEDHFLVCVDLPGVSEKDIEVKVQDGTLLLSGTREASTEEKTGSGYYSERRFGSFRRSFSLGNEVDAGKIEAAYNNGVLSVKLPKAEQLKPKQIPISTN